MPDSFQGKPPKSSESIRASLEAMRQDGGVEIPSGPRPDGIEPADQIVIASFYSVQACREFQRALSSVGIRSTWKTQSGRTCVSVDSEDRGHAVEILAAHEAEHPDERPPRIRRDYDFLIFGAVIGGTLGLVSLHASDRILSMVMIANLTVCGGLIGHLIDRFRSTHRKFGRIRFGVLECLLFITLVAFLLSLRHIIRIAVHG